MKKSTIRIGNYKIRVYNGEDTWNKYIRLVKNGTFLEELLKYNKEMEK